MHNLCVFFLQKGTLLTPTETNTTTTTTTIPTTTGSFSISLTWSIFLIVKWVFGNILLMNNKGYRNPVIFIIKVLTTLIDNMYMYIA